MGLFILWFIGALLIGAVGASRTIGFWSAFLLSILLSPIIGLFICLFYKTNEEEQRQKKQLQLQKDQFELLKNQQQPKPDIADQLEKLIQMRTAGEISTADFLAAKNKLLS